MEENRYAAKEAGPRDLFLAVPELAVGRAFRVNGEGEGYGEGLRIRILLVQQWVWHRLGGRGIQLELTGSKGVIH